MQAHRATRRFWESYLGLPEAVQRQADRSYRLLVENPSHPSLHLKKVGRFWSSRVGLDYRALAVEDEIGLIWVWIGTHVDYDQLIRR